MKSIECMSLRDHTQHRVGDTPTYGCSVCGQLVMSGGRVGTDLISSANTMVSVLSPSLNMWLPLPAMNQQRDRHGTCTVDGNNLMVVGGRTEGQTLRSVEVLKL